MRLIEITFFQLFVESKSFKFSKYLENLFDQFDQLCQLIKYNLFLILFEMDSSLTRETTPTRLALKELQSNEVGVILLTDE